MRRAKLDALSREGDLVMTQGQNFIIVNQNEPDLCWSNEFGWTVDEYDTFSVDERMTLRLPIEGIWEQVPWKKETEQ